MDAMGTVPSSKAPVPENGQARVIKVYLLDGKAVGDTPGWLSLVRLAVSDGLHIFLLDGKGYRVIAQEVALSLLNRQDQRSLLAIIKHTGSDARAASERNCIRCELAQGMTNPLLNSATSQATAYGNQLESDEIFSGGHGAEIAWALFKDYGNAFATNSNGAGVAEFLVRMAQARGWKTIRVHGSETFCHAVWVEADARGMRVSNYFPWAPDKAGPPISSVEKLGKSKPGLLPLRGARVANNQRLQPRVYSARFNDSQAVVDAYTAYEQAVVMARIYENLSQGIEREELWPMRSNGDVAAEGSMMAEPTLEQL